MPQKHTIHMQPLWQ